MSFAEAAARLAGLAGIAFGWTPDTFWQATPPELVALMRALAGEGAGAGPLSTLTMPQSLSAMKPGGAGATKTKEDSVRRTYVLRCRNLLC